MANEANAQALHDKASRGAVLTPAERTSLEAWYAQQDQEEAEALARSQPSADVTVLQAHVQAAMARLQVVTQRMQLLASENDRLRHEISALQRQATRPEPVERA